MWNVDVGSSFRDLDTALNNPNEAVFLWRIVNSVFHKKAKQYLYWCIIQGVTRRLKKWHDLIHMLEIKSLMNFCGHSRRVICITSVGQ